MRDDDEEKRKASREKEKRRETRKETKNRLSVDGSLNEDSQLFTIKFNEPGSTTVSHRRVSNCERKRNSPANETRDSYWKTARSTSGGMQRRLISPACLLTCPFPFLPAEFMLEQERILRGSRNSRGRSKIKESRARARALIFHEVSLFVGSNRQNDTPEHRKTSFRLRS